MWDAVFQKRFGYLAEAGFFVKCPGVNLRLQGDGVRVVKFPGGPDTGGNNLTCKAAAALPGDDPAQGAGVEGSAGRQQPEAG